MVATLESKTDAVIALHTSSASANEVPVELNKKHEPSASDHPGRHRESRVKMTDPLPTVGSFPFASCIPLWLKYADTFASACPGAKQEGPDGSSPYASQVRVKSVHISFLLVAD